jgi:translation initiation factor IF-3
VYKRQDLILINENADPPIVKVEDYHKFIYEQERAEKASKKNAKQNELKEIQLSVEIADHDLQTKANKAAELLGEGAKIRCVLSLKGRQKGRPERGEHTMLRFLEILAGKGVPEYLPKMEGSKWIVIIKPKK